jgi:hypothetical protein
MYKDDNRGTGRTTRMLQAASKRRRHTGRVLVVVHSANMIRYCELLSRKLDLDIPSAEIVTVTNARMRIRGMHYADIFVDHFVEQSAYESTRAWHDRVMNFFQELDLLKRTRTDKV